MAEINIEPRKKGGPGWLWILGILALIGIVAWLFAGNREDAEDTIATSTTEEVTTVNGANDANSGDMWRDVDLNAPAVKYPEITLSSPDFEVRGTDKYSIYSLGENLLFETDKATLSSDAKQNLDQIAASLKQRYGQGQIRIYGHADARADASHNEQLSQQRAEAVREWLIQNANVNAANISIHPMGESDPVATNATKSGQQQNRRVEIVAMNP